MLFSMTALMFSMIAMLEGYSVYMESLHLLIMAAITMEKGSLARRKDAHAQDLYKLFPCPSTTPNPT